MSQIDLDRTVVLLSYDVTGENRTAAARVAHLIFGRSDVRPEGTRPFILRPGVVWIGQSVFVMPASDADELAEKLRGLGAIVTTAPIAINPLRFEAFRRRARERRAA